MSKPLVTARDVYRIMKEFLLTTEPPDQDEMEKQFTAMGIDPEAIEPLMRTAGNSGMIMFTTIKVREDPDAEMPPNVMDVQHVGELTASVGITFFMIGFEVAWQVRARAES